MNELTQLPNIGKTISEKLKLAGITNAEELKEAGSEKAFIRLATIDNSACINMLYALEGAINEIRWHNLSPERKKELLNFFHLYNTNN